MNMDKLISKNYPVVLKYLIKVSIFSFFSCCLFLELHISWLCVFFILGLSMWLNELISLLLLEFLGDFSSGIGNHLGLISVQLDEGSGLGVVLAVGWSVDALAGAPVFYLLFVLDGLGFGSGWRLFFFKGLLLHVDLRFGLEEVAVLESALDKVEEVTNKLCLVLLIDFLEKLGVHFLLEEFVHVNLEVSLNKGLLSKSYLVHVGIHAHGFDFSHHLGLRLGLGGKFGGVNRSCQ